MFLIPSPYLFSDIKKKRSFITLSTYQKKKANKLNKQNFIYKIKNILNQFSTNTI